MIKCLIVDDEQLARRLLRDYLSAFEGFTVVRECESAIQAVQFLSTHEVDLLFLDINMPHLSGMELLRQTPNLPMTILCTAHSEYALESYDLDVVDYLLKPIGLARFTKAITKVLARTNEKPLLTSPPTEDASFFVKSDYKKIKIIPSEIRFIEAMEKYVRIHLRSDKVMTLLSMSAILKKLNPQKFLRIHRSYIINKEAVSAIEGNMLVIDEKKLPISKANKHLIAKFEE